MQMRNLAFRGLRLPRLGAMRSGGFSPASLFAGGIAGAWYGPSDLSTLFQDSAGTTPVTTTGQPVGLMLDKSKGLVLGPEVVTNGGGPFTSTTGYSAVGSATISIDTGRLKVVQTVGFTEGVFYLLPDNTFSNRTVISFDVDLGSSTLVQVQAGNGSFGNGGIVTQNITSSGTYNIITTVLRNGGSGITFKAGSATNFFLSRISIREFPGNHATQATAAARPTYQTGPARATLDKVDDRLSVTVPTGGFTGTMVLATDQGTASYGVTIPAGAYDIGGRGGLYFPGNAIVGQVIRDGALSAGDAAETEAHFVANGATASYGAVTSFSQYWRNWSEITSFPLIDTSAVTSFDRAWLGCTGLTSFPLIDTSAGTNFYAAWYRCTGLTSFPLIDTSSGTNFEQAWLDCTGLTSFPLIDTSAGTNFYRAWINCSSLTTIPAGLFDNVSGGNFSGAFINTALTQTSIDNVLVSLVASGISAGTRGFDQSGGSAPSATGEAAIDTLRSRGWTVAVTGGY